MQIIQQCQKVAMKCRKLENKRVEMLQASADEIDRLSKHIELLRLGKKNGILTWTKTFKRAIDKFKIISYQLDYDETQYLLPYDEYYRKQNIDVHLKSFKTYNKMLTQYEHLLSSNKLLIESLSNELSRLHNILFSLTNDIISMYTKQTMSYSRFIVSGYIRINFTFIGFSSFNTPENIINIIFKYFRFYEFQLINHYYNDKDEDDIEKYENLLLQSTTINQKRNLAVFNQNNIINQQSRSEIIVIDSLLSYQLYDSININLRIHGKPAIGFMKQCIFRRRKPKKNRYNQNEYILLNGQQSSMLSDSDDIPLIYDPQKIFKYKIVSNHNETHNLVFHGINDCSISVNMINKTAKIKIKSVSNDHKEIEYEFYDIPDNIYCVARINGIGNKITIIQ